MTPQQFIQLYREAFGEAPPLPIAFGYSNRAATTVRSIPRCMIGAISKVRDGEPLTLSADNVTCGGGGLYTAFAPMPERVPAFVSGTERYKQTREMVGDYIRDLDIHPATRPYLNFVRMDRLETFDGMEGILFFATPDVLSGLCSWAFYDNNAEDAVSVPFGSGCSSIVTLAVRENRRGGRRCFIGMLDPSARPLVPRGELTFTIPLHRFREMLPTIEHSSLFRKAYSILKKRINLA